MKKSEICFVYFNDAGMWKPGDLAAHFEDMKSVGGESIFTNFLEGSPGGLGFRTRLAHAAGLKVYASPGRVAGLFAAGPRPSSMFPIRRPDTLMRDIKGQPVLATSGLVCCVNNPGFQEWFFPHIAEILQKTGVDGVVFDEPKEAHMACYCEYCRALAGDDEAALVALHEKSLAATMGRVAGEFKAFRPDGAGLVMLMPNATGSFIDHVCGQSAIDCVGVDGPLCLQNSRPAPPPNQKTYILESAPPFFARIRAAGKKTFALAETFGVYTWALEELRRNIPKFAELGADVSAFNYYGHDSDDPEAVMEVVREAARLVRDRR